MRFYNQFIALSKFIVLLEINPKKGRNRLPGLRSFSFFS